MWPDSRRASLPASYKQFTKLDLPETAIDALLQTRVTEFCVDLVAAFPDFQQYPDPVCAALFDMAFNLGMTKLTGTFPMFCAAVKRRDWATAVRSMPPQRHPSGSQCLGQGSIRPGGRRREGTRGDQVIRSPPALGRNVRSAAAAGAAAVAALVAAAVAGHDGRRIRSRAERPCDCRCERQRLLRLGFGGTQRRRSRRLRVMAYSGPRNFAPSQRKM